MAEYFPGGVQRSMLGIGPMGGLYGSAPGFSDYSSQVAGTNQGYSAPTSLADLFTSSAGGGGYMAPQLPMAPAQTYAPYFPESYSYMPYIPPEPTSYAPPAAQPKAQPKAQEKPKWNPIVTGTLGHAQSRTATNNGQSINKVTAFSPQQWRDMSPQESLWWTQDMMSQIAP